MKPLFRTIFLLIFVWPAGLLAQVQLEGIVFDKQSKDRLGEVMIHNLSNRSRLFNNHKGEFRLDLREKDTVVFSKTGYFPDTLVVSAKPALIVSLLRDPTYIDPVHVTARRSPEQIRAENQREYRDAYSLADPGSLISVSPMGGAGLSINAIYNYLSKEGRNARRFTAYLEQVHRENVIDSIFTRDLVRNLVGLEGERLNNFMIRYRPSYEFAVRASHYELTNYIKSKYNMFKIMPDLRPLPELPQVEFDVKKEN